MRTHLRFAALALLIASGITIARPTDARAQQPPPAPPGAPAPASAAEGDAVRDSDDERILLRVKKGEEIDVEELLKDLSERRGQLIVADRTLRGQKVRFLTSADVTWDMIRFVLEMHGIRFVEQRMADGERVMAAMPARNLGGVSAVGGPFYDPDRVAAEGIPETQELLTAIVQIQNGAGNDIYSALRGLVGRDGDRTGNMLYIRGPEVIIIADLAPKARYYHQVITALDLPAPGQRIRLRNVAFAEATEVANTVSALLAGGAAAGRPIQPGGVGQTIPQVIADPRTNQLILRAFPHEFEQIEELIAALDVKVPRRSGRFHHYRMRHAEASEAAALLDALFNGGSVSPPAPVARPSVGSPFDAGAGNTVRPSPPAPPRPVRPRFGGAGAGGAPDGANRDEQPTRIIANPRTNSLIVQAEPEVYRDILEVLVEIDVKSVQIGIEAQVWEVAVPNDDFFLAVELAALEQIGDDDVQLAGASSFGLSQLTLDATGQQLTRVPAVGAGLLGVLANDGLSKLPLILNALATTSRSKLITQTMLFTDDNVPATLSVGDSVPFSSITSTNITSTASASFATAATAISVTPQVTGEDQLRLELGLTIQSFTGPSAPGLPPPQNDRTYTGKVTVPNMRWVVFGGLEREAETVSESKVPLLGDIPLFGHLFKSYQQTRNKTKIYIFVRPVILEDFGAFERVGRETRERMRREAEREMMPPDLIPGAAIVDPYGSLADRVYELFGTSSQNPFYEAATPGAAGVGGYNYDGAGGYLRASRGAGGDG